MLKIFCIALPIIIPLQAWAETTQPGAVYPESVVATESMTKMIVGLLLVLAIIMVVAWILKRFSMIPTTTAGHLKTIAAIGVGQRERVVIVEVGETWLVLGVAPGRVNTLHSMEKVSSQVAEPTVKSKEQFSEVLGTRIDS